jgi:predicted dehydrogenase
MKEPARILVIGAGSRGHAYANAIAKHSRGHGTIVGVAEPLPYKRREFQRRFAIADSLAFSSWTDVLAVAEDIRKNVDGICVCTLDETHAEVVTLTFLRLVCRPRGGVSNRISQIVLALRPLNLHVLCEKPLAVTLADCTAMHASVSAEPPVLLAVGHVLRYSPHNLLLHKLLVEDNAVGEVVNINHTEPVGYWHFAHSYVR